MYNYDFLYDDSVDPKDYAKLIDEEKKRVRFVWFRRIVGSFVALCLVIAGTLLWYGDRYQIALNITNSLPGTLYVVDISDPNYQPKLGDIVAFKAPPGGLYGDHAQFLKIIKGQAGDIVTWHQRTFFINDEVLGVRAERSSGGEPLGQGFEGKIPSNKYFVWTPHEGSYDSRYSDIGLIDRRSIIGPARLLF